MDDHHSSTAPLYRRTGRWDKLFLPLLLALGALLLLGGHVLRGFTAAMMLGIIVGTYSSVYVSSSLLISLGLTPQASEKKATKTNIAAQAERVGPRDDGAQP